MKEESCIPILFWWEVCYGFMGSCVKCPGPFQKCRDFLDGRIHKQEFVENYIISQLIDFLVPKESDKCTVITAIKEILYNYS